MTSRTPEVEASILSAFAAAKSSDTPYRHWIVRDTLPADVLSDVRSLPFDAPDLEVDGGTREANNKTRQYFDAGNIAKHSVVAEVCEAFQGAPVVQAVESTFGTSLADTYLRIEYAQDSDGFWLQPHTDIGVKRFTFLLYLSDGEGHEALGTDIYADADTHFGRSPFAPNVAMVFVPSANTWHGFEKRTIKGVRKSLIINYVTTDWRATEQLAYPGQLVPAAA